MKTTKSDIRILINNRLEKVQAEVYVLGDSGDDDLPFTGIVIGAVQMGHRKWQFYDLVSGHRFHEQRRTFRSPKQGLKHLESQILRQKFAEDLSLQEVAERAWLYNWVGGVPLMVNPVIPHLGRRVISGPDTLDSNMVAKPCPRCLEENWTLYEPNARPEEFPEDWKPDLAIECRVCGLRGPVTCHGIPHAMFRWNGAEWDETWGGQDDRRPEH